jgi:hypothetical protein
MNQDEAGKPGKSEHMIFTFPLLSLARCFTKCFSGANLKDSTGWNLFKEIFKKNYLIRVQD